MINHVSLIGRVSQRAEHRNHVAFVLIVDRPAAGTGCDFLPCVVYGRKTDDARTLENDNLVAIEGRLRSTRERTLLVSVHDIWRLA